MNDLPEDMILYIKENLYDYSDLLNLKKTNKQFDKLVTRFSIIKLMLYGKILNYKHIEMCINFDCFWDTIDIYENIYHYGYRRYLHYHQYALNQTNIIINNKQYDICSPYCTECLKQYILIGDKKNVINNLIMDQVKIEY